MGWKSKLIMPYARLIVRKEKYWMARALEAQERTFRYLLHQGRRTAFGRDHDFASIRDYESFKKQVPLRGYEEIKPYIERILEGEISVLWPGMPEYFSKTSGTTSGTKYIPLSKEAIPTHINSARNALMFYVVEKNDASVFDGKIMFISGSPKLEQRGNIRIGRLSGIVNYHVPAYAKANQLPSYEINCIEDFELKLEKIIDETINADMRMISGIPPWVQMYFEKIVKRTGRKVGEVFPNFNVLIYGGVNYEPYRPVIRELIGRHIDSIETYPASEGFIAYQDSQDGEGLLLNVRAGIFFEFIPMSEYGKPDARRLQLSEVEKDINYALVINNNAGLWGYDIGDMVRFVSKDPYRIVVTGRTRHYISAFGEHVIAEEVEWAMRTTAEKHGARIQEFHVAPMVVPPEGGLPYHEWFVEFDKEADDAEAFRLDLDKALRSRNVYYDDLIRGKILQPLKISRLRKDAFRDLMRSRGKLGGQNKIPRLANDRNFAEGLEKYRMEEEPSR